MNATYLLSGTNYALDDQDFAGSSFQDSVISVNAHLNHDEMNTDYNDIKDLLHFQATIKPKLNPQQQLQKQIPKKDNFRIAEKVPDSSNWSNINGARVWEQINKPSKSWSPINQLRPLAHQPESYNHKANQPESFSIGSSMKVSGSMTVASNENQEEYIKK